jgi:hypothetical protein
MPWWITVPGVLAVAIAAGFGVLAVWMRWNEPHVAMVVHDAFMAAEHRAVKQERKAAVNA